MANPFLSLGLNSWTQKFSRVPATVLEFLEYLTTSNTSSFTLRSSGTVNYEVDWGDGTVQSYTTNNPTHTYSTAGEYTIKITPAEGSTYRPHFSNNVSDTSIASVSGTGGSQLGTGLGGAWEGASNMTSFGVIDTSSVTIFNQAWSYCSGLTSFPLLDVSSGTSFPNAWQGCTGLTSFPLLDVSSGTSFSNTWNGCTGLTSFSALNASSGLNFSYAWYNCTGLTSFPLVDTSSATNFFYAWAYCGSLTSFAQLSTSNVTTFTATWALCTSLTSFPLIDTSSGTDFGYAWYGCSSLTSFPLIDTSSAVTLTDAWFGCALSAQSIENILLSLDANGSSNLSTSLSGGTNAGYSTWTNAAQTALSNLQGKGWSIAYNS